MVRQQHTFMSNIFHYEQLEEYRRGVKPLTSLEMSKLTIDTPPKKQDENPNITFKVSSYTPNTMKVTLNQSRNQVLKEEKQPADRETFP